VSCNRAFEVISLNYENLCAGMFWGIKSSPEVDHRHIKQMSHKPKDSSVQSTNTPKSCQNIILRIRERIHWCSNIANLVNRVARPLRVIKVTMISLVSSHLTTSSFNQIISCAKLHEGKEMLKYQWHPINENSSTVNLLTI
jgi:hypothetical protein